MLLSAARPPRREQTLQRLGKEGEVYTMGRQGRNGGNKSCDTSTATEEELRHWMETVAQLGFLDFGKT